MMLQDDKKIKLKGDKPVKKECHKILCNDKRLEFPSDLGKEGNVLQSFRTWHLSCVLCLILGQTLMGLIPPARQ